MAIWQYSFLVVPKLIMTMDGGLKSYLNKDGSIDDESIWLVDPVNINFFNEIEQILPRNKSWNSDIILFGNEESNCFEVYKNRSDSVISVSFRIDYTNEYEDVLRLILDFTLKNELLILDENLKILSNNFISIKSKIDNSRQQSIYIKMMDKNS